LAKSDESVAVLENFIQISAPPARSRIVRQEKMNDPPTIVYVPLYHDASSGCELSYDRRTDIQGGFPTIGANGGVPKEFGAAGRIRWDPSRGWILDKRLG
jgi:hypothetical protein